MKENNDALIGSTGFVGGNLLAQHPFAHGFNSRNIEDIHGREFDLIVSAGTPAVKWRANQDPAADWEVIRRLMTNLESVRARRFVLISTLNVYQRPQGVNEDDPIDETALQPYGRHRYLLERFVVEHFPHNLIVRLPGIFGPGLKKNFLFDLREHNSEFLAKVHVRSIVQFYDLKYLWSDIQRAMQHKISLLNMATEPLLLQKISREIFGYEFKGRTEGPVYHDDMRSKYGKLWGTETPYLYSSEQVMEDLRSFFGPVS